MQEATREILWNIPVSFKLAMYGLLVVATAVFLLGLQKKLSYILQGRSLKLLIPSKPNWKNFFSTIFFQGKVVRDRYVAVFHSLIFYGFIILWVATDLVAIHFDTPFLIFKGPVYIVVSFLADVAGIAILLGISIAYYRRYVKSPKYLSATRPKSELFMYAMLLSLVVVGYLIEGLRILGTGMPEGEKFYAPVGWFLANIIQGWGPSETALAFLYRGLWAFHVLNTMAFIASLTWTKFFHIIMGPFSAIYTQDRQGAVLNPMDFSNENVETFGLAKLSDLTVKERIDTLSCVECGRCTQVCPANLAGKPLDPKTIVTKVRDLGITSENQSISLWDANLYASNELDSCTTCGACMQECPMNIEHVQLIMDLKRYKALTTGDLPPAAADAVNKIKKNGNPWGITQDDRMLWAQGLEVPVAEVGKKIDYLYYVGCAGSYDSSNQKVVRDTVTLLKKAGVSFAVMGKTEKCNGDPIRRFGDEYSFFEVAIENIANMRKYTFDKVVTHCPHCLHTIGKEYAKFENGSFTTIHHTELLADLVEQKKLIPTKTINEEVTYHDPCYLGRHHGEYDAPRSVLHAIPGIKLVEMEKNKDKALCCGMGGGNMWYELPEGKHVVLNRLEHVGETKTTKLATSCSFCMINFNSSKGQLPSTENINIEDISQFLARSVD
jgi:Fe-S oxidoreductase